MAKFDLKKAILENKATFFGSLTEGQFSWMTQDTGQQIGSQDENKIPVYMFDNKGKYYYENDYDGYGEFGGKDYYDLVAEMNGYTADDAEKFGGTFGELRGIGIKLAFGELEPKNGGPVLFPALVTKPDKFNYRTHNFAVEAETDPNQSWYEPEEDEEDNSFDLDDNEDFGYNDDEDDDMMEGLNKGKMYFHVLEDGGYGNIGHQGVYNTKEEAQNRADKLADMFPASSFYVEASDSKDEPYNVTMEGKKQYYKDAEADDAEHIKALEKDMKDDKTSGKMKMSEFKAKIKEMILNEMEDEKVVDVNDETPESEEDFLAELEGMLDEADETEKDTAEAEDVTVDDTETIDTETEVEVDPNVKAVQDALTQAQVAAQKLGDPKLTDQIGNTITFFTREHVVEKPKSAVAEGDLMKNIGKGLEYEATEEMIRDYATGLLNNLKDNSHQFSDAEDLFDFYLANPQDFPKSMDYNFFKNNYDDILSLAMTGLNEGKKEDKKEKDVAKDLNESMFPMLKKILK